MLDLSRCRFKFDKEIPVKTGQTITAEGLALATEIENGVEVLSPSAGSGSEKFAGFSYGEKFTVLTLSMVVTATVPATGTFTVTLPRTNLVPDNVFVYDDTAGSDLTEAGAVASGVYTADDPSGVLTFHTDEKGHNITSTFRYYPTVQEVMTSTDQFFYKPSGSDFLNQIGIILSGEVFTDQYDAAVDWSSATAVKTDASGQLTDHTGSGVDIGATIINIPNTENSFLGLRFGV